MGGSRSHSEFLFSFFGKSSQNSSKLVLIFLNSTPCMCLLFVCTLLKVVTYYDLSVLSMSVMGFQKEVWMGCELYPSLLWIFF